MAQLVKIENNTDSLIFNSDVVRIIYIDEDNDVQINFTDGTTNYLYCDSKKEAKKAIANMSPFNFSDEHKTLDV